jgi:phosphoribosylamine--glycine ligase
MGSYSPPHFATPELYRQAYEQVLQPTVAAMAHEGRPYQGVLYGGLMITDAGPKTLEFNARFGDPETQIVLPRLKTDLVDIMLAVIEGRLDQVPVEWHDEMAVGVVLASGGYPGKYRTGLPVSGLDTVDDDVTVFHAGTRLEGDMVVTSGGRVLSVVATGKTLDEARGKVYENIPRISFEGSYYRRDIALV